MDVYSSIFAAVFLVSLVSFVGAFTLSIRPEVLKRFLFVLVSVACGALFGNAIIHLIPEAFELGGEGLAIPLAILGGILAFFSLEKFLRWHHAHHGFGEEICEECEKREDRHHVEPTGPLILIADGVHNMLDGAIIASAFLVNPALGVATTVGIVLHEIPQEIGDFGLLMHAGYTRKKALIYNFISALGAVLGAVIMILAANTFTSFLPLMIAFAAGNFLYVAGSDLLPELHKTTDLKKAFVQLFFLIVGIGSIVAVTTLVVSEHEHMEMDELHYASSQSIVF